MTLNSLATDAMTGPQVLCCRPGSGCFGQNRRDAKSQKVHQAISTTWTPKLCKPQALKAIFRGLGLLCDVLLRSRNHAPQLRSPSREGRSRPSGKLLIPLTPGGEWRLRIIDFYGWGFFFGIFLILTFWF